MVNISLFIKNAKIFIEGSLVQKNILVEVGKIKELTTKKKDAEKIIDAKGKIVLPGIIDPHVHLRDPGLTKKEDFFTGSKAAAAGGITTVLDMPNTVPETITLEALEQKRKLAKKSVVNYGFHFGAAKDNIKEIKEAENVASVKLFMNISTGNMKIDDKDALKDIFENSKLVFVHAEKEKVSEAIRLNKDYGKGLYLAHISLRSELEEIKKAKERKENVYAEVTPHHLFMTRKDFEKQKGYADMKPNLKSKDDQLSLWEGINDKTIDTIGTDHAPHTIEEKNQINYPFGVPGLETSLPLMLNAVNDKMISLKKVVELMSENPAKIFKIRNKGFIKGGYDADLTIVDMNLKKEVKNENLLTRCRWSPFKGKILKGWPVTTIVNGKIIYDDNKINNIKAREVEYYD